MSDPHPLGDIPHQCVMSWQMNVLSLMNKQLTVTGGGGMHIIPVDAYMWPSDFGGQLDAGGKGDMHVCVMQGPCCGHNPQPTRPTWPKSFTSTCGRCWS